MDEIPVAVMPLEYAGMAATAARRVDRRVGQLVGWAAVVVGVADAAAGVFGLPFAFPGRRLLVGYDGLAMLAVAWVGNGICVAAGVGLLRRRPWGPLAFRAFAVYSVAYSVILASLRAAIVLSYGGTPGPLPPLVMAGEALLPAVHWAAFPVGSWLVLRTTRE